MTLWQQFCFATARRTASRQMRFTVEGGGALDVRRVRRPMPVAKVLNGSGKVQHQPVARIEALYRKWMARKCPLRTFQSPHLCAADDLGKTAGTASLIQSHSKPKASSRNIVNGVPRPALRGFLTGRAIAVSGTLFVAVAQKLRPDLHARDATDCGLAQRTRHV